MPRKRVARGTATYPDDTAEDKKPKKRRVSLACDACRAAREKCDGERPQCGACAALDRPCSYTPATKKRGVQTGYLRTIELSLAWLFDQIPECEEALYGLLAQPGPGRERHALFGRGSKGHHLQKVWNETRVRKAIDALLADTQNVPPPSDSSDNDQVASRSDCPIASRDGGGGCEPRLATDSTIMTMQDSPDTPGSDRILSTILRLPPHWERLMTIYISCTHCWLPIVRPEALRALVFSYGASGIHVDLDGDRSAYSRLAELWAVLAIAAFQDDPDSKYRNSPELSASRIFRVARSLVPDEDEFFDSYSINAIILHSVVFIGQGTPLPASVLLGKAARLLRRLQHSGNSLKRMHRDVHEFDYSTQIDTSGIACSLLGTLASLSMKQYAAAQTHDATGNNSPAMAEFAGFDHAWQSGPPGADLPEYRAMHPKIDPIRTLMQVHALTTALLRGIVYPRLRDNGDTRSRPMGPDDLAQTLDPCFHYCHSFVSGNSTPTTPSAFLVKLLFITATIELAASHLHTSLLSGFLEIVKSCVSNLGANRTPPLVSLLLQMLEKRASLSDLSEAEQSSWRSLAHTLRSTWQDSAESSLVSEEMRRQQHLPNKTTLQVRDPGDLPSETETHSRHHPGSSPRWYFRQNVSAGDILYAPQPRFGGYQQPVAETAAATEAEAAAAANPGYAGPVAMSSAAQTPGGAAEEDTHAQHMEFPGEDRINQNFDYEALFEDLGSIGCTSVEMDTRFMSALGFAPGCDLVDMFEGDCGV